MNLADRRSQFTHELVEGNGQRISPADEHVVMLWPKRRFASPGGLTKPSPDAIALRRVADALGNREAESRLIVARFDHLQLKSRAPGAIAPGGP